MCTICEEQQLRRSRYERLIKDASCYGEVRLLKEAYEVSRLIFINHPDVAQRDNMMLREKK